MRLLAIEDFTYRGFPVRAGDEFDADEVDTLLLTQSLHPRAMLAEQAKPAKRKYKRRDMRAEV